MQICDVPFIQFAAKAAANYTICDYSINNNPYLKMYNSVLRSASSEKTSKSRDDVI